MLILDYHHEMQFCHHRKMSPANSESMSGCFVLYFLDLCFKFLFKFWGFKLMKNIHDAFLYVSVSVIVLCFLDMFPLRWSIDDIFLPWWLLHVLCFCNSLCVYVCFMSSPNVFYCIFMSFYFTCYLTNFVVMLARGSKFDL